VSQGRPRGGPALSPPTTASRITPIARQFLRFACVGALTFFVDAGVLTLALAMLPGSFYLGRVVSYLAAASTGWWLNRYFTFGGGGAKLRQWARYLLTNLGGGLANYAVYAVLVALVPLCRAYPPIAVGAGSLAGLVLNFLASRRFVFGP
jgi:putative flippase GtrA